MSVASTRSRDEMCRDLARRMGRRYRRRIIREARAQFHEAVEVGSPLAIVGVFYSLARDLIRTRAAQSRWERAHRAKGPTDDLRDNVRSDGDARPSRARGCGRRCGARVR